NKKVKIKPKEDDNDEMMELPATQPSPGFICEMNACGKRFKKRYELNRHQRNEHLQIKPYRCTWPGCQHRCSENSAAIRHVRSTHFRRSSRGQADREAKWNPNLYIAVDRELLNQPVNGQA